MRSLLAEAIEEGFVGYAVDAGVEGVYMVRGWRGVVVMFWRFWQFGKYRGREEPVDLEVGRVTVNAEHLIE